MCIAIVIDYICSQIYRRFLQICWLVPHVLPPWQTTLLWALPPPHTILAVGSYGYCPLRQPRILKIIISIFTVKIKKQTNYVRTKWKLPPNWPSQLCSSLNQVQCPYHKHIVQFLHDMCFFMSTPKDKHIHKKLKDKCSMKKSDYTRSPLLTPYCLGLLAFQVAMHAAKNTSLAMAWYLSNYKLYA